MTTHHMLLAMSSDEQARLVGFIFGFVIASLLILWYLKKRKGK